MSNQYNIIIKAQDNASKELNKIGKTVKSLSKSMKKSSSGFSGKTFSQGYKQASVSINKVKKDFGKLYKEHQQKISSMASSVAKWGAGLSVGLGYGITNFAKSGAKLQQLEREFKRMTGTMGLSADEVRKSLEEASAGTISSQDLILSANKSMALGVTKNMEDFTTIMEIARKKGQAMGLDTKQAFDDLVTGLGRGSPMILDNLGIVLKVGEAYDQYAKEIGKVSSELSASEQKQAIINKVVKQGKKEIEETGKAVLSSAEKFQQMSKKMQDMKDTLGKALLPTMEKIIEAVSLTLNKFTKWVKNNKELASTLAFTTVKVLAFITATSALIFSTTKLISIFTVLKSIIKGEIFINLIKNSKKAVAGLNVMASAMYKNNITMKSMATTNNFVGTSLKGLASSALSFGKNLLRIAPTILAITAVVSAGVSAYNQWNFSSEELGKSQEKLVAINKVVEKSQKDYVGTVFKMAQAEEEHKNNLIQHKEALKGFAKEISDIKKSFEDKIVSNRSSMAEKIVSQEEKLKTLEEEINEKKSEIKKAIAESHERDIDKIKKESLDERISELQLEQQEKEGLLEKERIALDGSAQLQKNLTTEILEVKRRSQLTEFERAIEDFNKKRELIQKNLSQQILAITIKKNTAIEAFNAEEEKFKEYQKTMRAEQTKTTLNWLRMLAIKEQASGNLKGKEKADKFYQEAGIGYRLGEIVKDSSIGIAEWLTGKQSTWQTAGEIIIEREREEMKKTTNNFNINIQKKISEAGDNEEVLNEIMNEVKKYLDQAK